MVFDYARWSRMPLRTAAMAMAALPRRVEAPGRNVWPYTVSFRQAASLGVGHYVFPLFAVAVVRPDAMIKCPWLPPHLTPIARGPFEFPDRVSDAYGFWDDGYQVHVVWHG